MIQDKINALKIRHDEIDKKIEQGYTNYIADNDLKKMKQEKLYIKDQIENLTKQL